MLQSKKKKHLTLPETNITSPLQMDWLEYDPFLLGSRPIFIGEPLVSGRVNKSKMRMEKNPKNILPNGGDFRMIYHGTNCTKQQKKTP